VFANLVRDKVDTPKITSQEARTEVFESVDKHGLAVCLLFDCYNWPKRTPDWLLFKDLDAPLRLYTCDTVKPTSQNTRFDPFYDTPFYSWPRILANLRQFFKTNLGVDAPALDDNYLSARQATIESKSLELGVGASTSNSQEMRDVLMPLQEPKLGDELSAPSNSTRKRKLGDQRGEPATKQPAI
jgi:hypothetical protein